MNPYRLSCAIDVPYQTVLAWVHGHNLPRTDSIELIAQALGCDYNEFCRLYSCLSGVKAMLHNNELWHNEDKTGACWHNLGCAIVLEVIREMQKFYRYQQRAAHGVLSKLNRNLAAHYRREVNEHIEWLMGDECHLFCGHRFTGSECLRILSDTYGKRFYADGDVFMCS